MANPFSLKSQYHSYFYCLVAHSRPHLYFPNRSLRVLVIQSQSGAFAGSALRNLCGVKYCFCHVCKIINVNLSTVLTRFSALRFSALTQFSAPFLGYQIFNVVKTRFSAPSI